jgi:hypothetical protein
MAGDDDIETFNANAAAAAAADFLAEACHESPGTPAVDPPTPVTAAKARATSALKASASAAYAAEQTLARAEVEMFSPIRAFVLPPPLDRPSTAAATMPPSPGRAKPLTALAARMLRRNTNPPAAAAKAAKVGGGGNVRKSAESDFWTLSDDEDEIRGP